MRYQTKTNGQALRLSVLVSPPIVPATPESPRKAPLRAAALASVSSSRWYNDRERIR